MIKIKIKTLSSGNTNATNTWKMVWEEKGYIFRNKKGLGYSGYHDSIFKLLNSIKKVVRIKINGKWYKRNEFFK